ncbi:choice-of-anchor M domain-containing protein [Corynebacterium timonense]|uniref:Surface-anchored protein n=1 Tax=Corynebacterium timonense TaxID=441500 RepID=A0A1H1PW70_9CORY|nr:choice-of-anchor M domain-containing protein [Corynebacterium timonense]SDS15480.1 surface-anchored protein [Corynebacterium timonense]
MFLRTRAAAVTVAASLALSPAAFAAMAPVDPALKQTVTADEAVADPGTAATVEAGHVDLGPLPGANPGEFDLLARDDTAVPPIWRHTDDVVLRVGDAAAQTLPDNEQFEFIGAQPGASVWVVPQTEVPGVPWLGWNTQNPDLISAADRGVTFEFAGHQGPGRFSLFLQNGGFEPPQVLWNSDAEGAQPFFAELNTHTHANWVFTEPGIHQVALRVTVPLLDGGETSATKVITFAVGDATDVNAAQQAQWQGDFRAAAESDAGAGPGASEASNAWWLAGAGVLVLVVVAVALVAVRRKGGRR